MIIYEAVTDSLKVQEKNTQMHVIVFQLGGNIGRSGESPEGYPRARPL